jgi:phenylalanyl-tRNA synthetase beta chain
VAEMLTSQGFNEIWSNSLTKSSYYEGLEQYKDEQSVKMLNPLSADLNGMRQTLLFGGLECIAYNANRQNKNLKIYEFGNTYFYKGTQLKDQPANNYWEESHLGLFVTGNKEAESWTMKEEAASFYGLKSYAENILKRLGLSAENMQVDDCEDELFSEALAYTYNNKVVLKLGIVAGKWLKKFEIENPVYYADFNWDSVFKAHKQHKVLFNELPKFPAVRRDLALLLDKSIKFSQLKEAAFKMERQLLREVDLFDVYEGKGVPEGKKSYAVSFILRDDSKTLKDKQIDKTMQKLIMAFQRDFGAELR